MPAHTYKKIPKTFIDQLMSRVDIVEVIDRRVPLIRKGKEYQACCPFHDEKTPSFTVSPSKQFYHCFGCAAHGTAIGFLMDYANLGFVEAVEELAASAGIEVPRENAQRTSESPAESPTQLIEIVAEANRWFQQQLRTPGAKAAIAYLKQRGLDGRVAADFGIGYAPDGWDNLTRALGDNALRQQQLLKAGLVAQREKAGLYDRFRERVIFPIEDHRGRVVAFGGRILGAGEPKYLNSPETPLFHKGAELYGLHRARREIGLQQHSIVVEGYMDVVGLAQFGVDNAVATLGTATTRTHVQRLFRLAEEIVFCFDGDRAGRAAAWKAVHTILPEMHDGRQAKFLFLPEGEDPDSVVRKEGKEGFIARVADAAQLEDFLIEHLRAQVDLKTSTGNASLIAEVKPLIERLPGGALQELMWGRLTRETGLLPHQINKHQTKTPRSPRRAQQALAQGQLSPLALAISLLLQNPSLAASIPDPKSLQTLTIKGAEILLGLIEKITQDADITTARLLESLREDSAHGYLEKLATRTNLIEPDALAAQFNDTLAHLLEDHAEQRRRAAIEAFQHGEGTEKQELKQQIKQMFDERKETMKGA